MYAFHSNIIPNFDSDLLLADAELHLLEYKERTLEYLQCYATRQPVSTFFTTLSLKEFSAPRASGYADTSITDETITAVYLEYAEKTRKIESQKYLRTLSGKQASKSSIVSVLKSIVTCRKMLVSR